MKEHEQNMQEFNQKQLRKSEGTEDQEEGGSIEVYQNNVQYKANDMVTESSPDMSKTDGFIDDGDDIPSSSLADSPISPQKREMNDIVVHQQQQREQYYQNHDNGQGGNIGSNQKNFATSQFAEEPVQYQQHNSGGYQHNFTL